MPAKFELQGHRGARGLRPENTLPSFEAALDAGVTTIETDLHLTRDGVVVLCHEPYVSAHLFRDVAEPRPICQLTLAELRQYEADRNPDPARFPAQDATVTPLAARFAAEHDIAPYAVPTLADLLTFAAAYAGAAGDACGKSEEKRARAGQLRFDLELKRVPFFPESINDGFDGQGPALLEKQVLEAVYAASVEDRTTVRSFDHRSVCCLLQLEPKLTAAALMAETTPIEPALLTRQLGASMYCSDYRFLDADLVRRTQAAGVRVVPWTVNDPAHWRRLLDWDVDGITTDFPDQLATELLRRNIDF